MQKFGFFNAIKNGDEYDRKYNANDYSENLAVVISNGVLRSENDDLKVTAEGMDVKVNSGRAWIKGHFYVNDSEYVFDPVTAPTSGSRIDRVILRFNNDINARSILLTYVQGESSNNPVPPAPVRVGDIYDIVLADIYVGATATSVIVTDQRQDKDLCGWVYSTSGDNSFFTSLDNSFYEWFTDKKDELSSVTLFKKYKWRTVLTSSTNTIQFNIPQFDEQTCFIEVYVNGILDTEGVDYSRTGNVLTGLGLPLVAGTEVEVNCYKSIDGTGIMSVSDEITELQNQMEQVQGNAKYVYKCTGLDDNISLSQIASSILANGYHKSDVSTVAATFLEGLGARNISGDIYTFDFATNAQITIDVVGYCGVETPYSGTGSQSSRYKYFALGEDTSNDKRLIFDFAKCEKVSITCAANSSNIIFYGQDLNIKNANVYVSSDGSSCNITMIAGRTDAGTMNFENSIFNLVASGQAIISRNGTFTNCDCTVRSSSSSAICFYPQGTGGLMRVFGGRFASYVPTGSQSVSAIVCVESGQADAVLLAENIHCPTIAVTGYEQKNLIVALSGTTIINGVVSRLTSSGSYYTITNQVNKSKS